MKGIQELLSVGLAVILLGIFLVAVYYLLGTFGRFDDQTALLNAPITASAMDEACKYGVSTVNDLRFTQASPPKPVGLDFFPRLTTKITGDPNYVIYYEAFPPGEGIGWEVYNDFHYRLISPFIYTDSNGNVITQGINAQDFMAKLKEHINHVEAVSKTKIATGDPEEEAEKLPVLVSNIELNDYTDVIPGQETENNINIPGISEEGKSNLGKWDEERKRYRFLSYSELSSLEKSFIKYRPCGNNYLCMKTPESVYRFKLDDSCSDIAFVQIAYDSRDPLPIATVALDLSYAFAQFFVLKQIPLVNPLYFNEDFINFVVQSSSGYKSSEFYLASPCVIPDTIEIRRDKCVNEVRIGNRVPAPGFGACQKIRGYPIYGFSRDINDVQQVEFKGYHYYCLDEFGEDVTDLTSVGYSQGTIPSNPQNLDCLKVIVTTKKKDFCWTGNAKHVTEPTGSWWKDIVAASRNKIQSAVDLFTQIGGLPVTATTQYFDDPQTVVLEPTSNLRSDFGVLRNYLGKWFTWGWP